MSLTVEQVPCCVVTPSDLGLLSSRADRRALFGRTDTTLKDHREGSDVRGQRDVENTEHQWKDTRAVPLYRVQ